MWGERGVYGKGKGEGLNAGNSSETKYGR